MIRFAHPNYLHLLWLIPLILFVAIYEFQWRKKALLSWANAGMLDAVLPERAPIRILIKRVLLIVAVALIVLAVAGPQVGTRMIEVTREGTDVVIALDVSKSMLAEDIVPNRLLKARHEILGLLQMLKGDRVALVPFAGVAFVQVPLTLDYGACGAVLNALEPGMIPHPGTALGEAIAQARRAFRTDSKAQKSLILITDGEDHENGALEQAKEAAKEGVIIFTIGMASQSGAPIPEKDAVGRITGYKTEKGGGTVISRLNEQLLSDIASATGGEFYRDNPQGDEFRRIYEKLVGMDKQKFEQKQFTDYEDRFQWPLLLAFLLLLLEEIIPPYRQKKAVVLFILLGLGLTSTPSFAQSPRKSASKGITHYEKEEYDKALTEFLAGLEKAGDHPELRYDLGTALYRLQQFPEAAEAFDKAAQKNPKLAADAWYNLGNSMYEGQKYDDAVKAYTNSLKLNHDDKDAKHNLELALRAKQMQMQQQPKESQSGQDSTKQQQKENKQQQQKPKDDEKKQQEQQANEAQPDSSKADQPKPKPGDENKMSKEEAMQLLQALEGDEQDAQKEKLIRQFGEPKKVQKDW